MKRYKNYILVVAGIAMLLVVGCHRDELIDDDKEELRFSPTLGLAQTADSRVGELDNNVLHEASAAGAASPHIKIDTYTGKPGSSLNGYFADELGYFSAISSWDLNSNTKRFLPNGGMNLYAYFATNSIGKGDLTGITYTSAKDAQYPKLAFNVAKDESTQTDLIAAKVEGITNSSIHIPLRHILSQINFGVKGLNYNQIVVKNIQIKSVKGSGVFDYNTLKWVPNASISNYSYHFPDRTAGQGGLGDKYQTQGTDDDSKNSYIFGDGGKFGPGKDATFLYAQKTLGYATQENTLTSLNNSLMLLPQPITKNSDATVTFDYEITNQGTVIRSGLNSTIKLNAYYDWEPNMRYVYIFKFDDPGKITFDVLIEPWIESTGNIETDELNGVTLFENNVRAMKSGDSYSVPLGALSSDFICDWSLYTLDNSFTAVDQIFSLSFDNKVSFEGGKSVIIKPPFGFKASTSKLTAPGIVTFTPIYPYYTTSEELNAAIVGSGNYMFSVRDNVKLDDIKFTGSNTAERSLSLRYLAPYGAALPDDRWSMYDPNTMVCFPNDYALISNAVPYSYTVYTVQGLKDVFDWMNIDGVDNPGGSNSSVTYADRMQTNINLAQVGRYNLADVYANATNGKPLFVPIGNAANPYSGTFDGKGATISNLYLNANWTGTERGFFGNASGTIQYLNLANVSVVATGDYLVGGLIGFNRGGTVRGCSVQGSIHGSTTGNGYTGGIAGQNNGFIFACSSTASVNNATSGGITGVNMGQVWSCYATNDENIVGINSTGDESIKSSYYVAASNIGTNAVGVTRVPSIAVLNGLIPQLNETIINVPAHFVSGDLNATPPSVVVGSPAKRKGGGVLKGTFIQNWFALGWDQNRWNAEMALLATIGMKYLVIDQVMECNVSKQSDVKDQYMSWYKPLSNVLVNDNLDINASENALEYCMKACRAHDIKLFIGTFFDKRYWDEGAAVSNQTKWNNCIITSNNIMDDLITKYFHGGAGNYNDVLAGWYFPYEIDDSNFKTPSAQAILKEGVKLAMDHRNALATNVRKPYLFSPFMNGSGGHAMGGTMNEVEYSNLWRDIISSTNFRAGDILSPQDCIGIDKLTISDIGRWMPKLKEATTAVADVEFWINVEIFDYSNTNRLINEQIPASNAHTTELISFSYPIYYSPNSGAYKQGDHDAYKAYYDAQ